MDKIIDLQGLGLYHSLLKEYLSTIKSDMKVGTTSEWNSDKSFIPNSGQLIIYSDGVVKDGVSYPRYKVGDGKAFLIDLPWGSGDVETLLKEHIDNASIHLSANDRTKLGESVTASYGDNENLILSK